MTTEKRMAFVSRHEPTPEQIALAKKDGYELVHVGDMDAFDHDLDNQLCKLIVEGGYAAVACVHAMIAIRVLSFGTGYSNPRVRVAIFENAQRPSEGGKPTFYAKAMHVLGQHCDCPELVGLEEHVVS